MRIKKNDDHFLDFSFDYARFLLLGDCGVWRVPCLTLPPGFGVILEKPVMT
jgi:hypothetical protein